MRTEEIPRGDWNRFLDAFSDQHRGGLVYLEVMSPSIGDQIEAKNVPLESIVLEAEQDDRSRLYIQTGSDSAARSTHVVEEPSHIHILRTDEGRDDTLEIESTDGEKMLLRFPNDHSE